MSMQLPFSRFSLLSIIVAGFLAVSGISCDIFDLSAYKLKITSTNGDFAGTLAIDGEASSSISGKKISGTFYEYNKDLSNYNSLIVTAQKSMRVSVLTVYIYRQNDIDEKWTLTSCNNDTVLEISYSNPDANPNSDDDNNDTSTNTDSTTDTSLQARSDSVLRDDVDGDGVDDAGCVGTSSGNVPNQITGVALTPGTEVMTISWTDPGDTSITQYTINYGTDSSSLDQSETVLVSTLSDTSYTITGLTSATEYFFTITATNTNGTSDASDVESDTVN
jgi:hypothetical protein